MWKVNLTLEKLIKYNHMKEQRIKTEIVFWNRYNKGICKMKQSFMYF